MTDAGLGVQLAPAACHDCGLAYGDDGWIEAVIPRDVWVTISPDGAGNGLLCITCMARRLRRAGLETTVTLRGVEPFRLATGMRAIIPTEIPWVDIRSHPRNLMDAAERVLAGAGRPLHIREIVNGIWALGWYKAKRYEALRSTMVSTMNRKAAGGDTFVKVGSVPSTYALVSQDDAA